MTHVHSQFIYSNHGIQDSFKKKKYYGQVGTSALVYVRARSHDKTSNQVRPRNDGNPTRKNFSAVVHVSYAI